MANRALSGRLVVAAVIVLAVGGTYLVNVLTAGPPQELDQLLSPRTGATGTPRGTVEIAPSSRPATPGRGEGVDLVTPCGFVTAVDFDGSFWEPADGRPLRTVARRLALPVDPSTVTLQAETSALLRTAAGQVLVLVRSPLARVAKPVC
jgi:hypothetical protein